jgi:hypothetical protein
MVYIHHLICMGYMSMDECSLAITNGLYTQQIFFVVLRKVFGCVVMDFTLKNRVGSQRFSN